MVIDMKSMICNWDGTVGTLNPALTETEYFGDLCALSHKQCLHLRLLTEELLGITSNLLAMREGCFWIEEEKRQFDLHLAAQAEVDLRARDKRRNASSGMDEMYKGISGKVRQALDWFLNPHIAGAAAPVGVYNGMMLALNPVYQEWSLECYRDSLSQVDKTPARDELEKSVLGKLADDVRVGAKADCFAIVIRKKF